MATSPEVGAGELPAAAPEPAWVGLRPVVLAYVRAIVAEGDAEDVVQQTFLEAWQHRGRMDPGRPAEPYLLTIARRRSLDALRRRYRQADRAHELPDVADAAPALPVDGWVESEVVRRALATLPDEQREAIVLAYFAGLTQAEIAERLGQPLGTVKARTSRGLRRLAAAVVEDGAP